MKFLIDLEMLVVVFLKSIDAVTWIALVACLVALLSLIEAKRANNISKDSLGLAKTQFDNQRKIDCEKEKADILRALCDEREICQETWAELCTIRADYSIYPPVIKFMLENYENLFELIPKMEKLISDIDNLYLQVKNLDSQNQTAFIEMKTEQYLICKNTLYGIRRCQYCIGEFKARCKLAVELVLKTSSNVA